MKNLRIQIAFALLFSSALAFGQTYITAGGIRIDNGVNLTVQQYIADGWTAEGILHTSIGSNDLGITILGEKHHKLIARNFNIYTGAGFHYYGTNDPIRKDDPVQNNVYGLSLIGGAELSLGRINLAIDWKPELHVSGGRAFDWNGAALSVRYIFFKRERKTIKDWKVWDRFEKKDKGNSKKKR